MGQTLPPLRGSPSLDPPASALLKALRAGRAGKIAVLFADFFVPVLEDFFEDVL